MTPSEAAKLLSLAAAFDQRTIGEADAAAWADALSDVSLAECQVAVREHYKLTTSRIMPAHVRAHVFAAKRAVVEHVHAERLHTTLPPLDHESSHRGYLAAVEAVQQARGGER